MVLVFKNGGIWKLLPQRGHPLLLDTNCSSCRMLLYCLLRLYILYCAYKLVIFCKRNFYIVLYDHCYIGCNLDVGCSGVMLGLGFCEALKRELGLGFWMLQGV
jgi:hypothetical protein